MSSHYNSNRAAALAELSQLMIEFNTFFPSEESCVEKLFCIMFPEKTFLCAYCGNKTGRKGYGKRFAWCTGCKRKCWFTAGTFFHGTKKVRLWLAAFWLMQKVDFLNTALLKQVLEISLSTAWNLLQSVSAALQCSLKDNYEILHPSYFADLLFRGNLGSQENTNLQPELEGLENNSSFKTTLDMQFLSGEDDNQPDGSIEVQICKVLSTGAMSFDQLYRQFRTTSMPELSLALLNLELENKISLSTGNIYSLVKKQIESHKELSALLSESIKKCRQIISYIFQGISAKYLQNYLAFVQFLQFRDSSDPPLSVVTACLSAPKTIDREIARSICPQFVKYLSSKGPAGTN